MENLKFTFSIVICTYNRSAYLDLLTKSIIEQNYPIESYEIIFVDNASTDNTADIVKRFSETYPHKIIYAFEPKQGLSNARNTGAKVASNDVLAYIDDDATASPEWLEKLAFEFANDKQVVCVGGRIDLDWQVPHPYWLPAELESYLGCNHHLGTVRRELPSDLYPFEGNFAVYRKLILGSCGFNSDFGMKGNKIGVHDGIGMVEYLRQYGKIFYAPEAVVYHSVPEWRTTPSYFIRRGFQLGMGDTRLGQLRKPRNQAGLLRALAADFLFLAAEIRDFVLALFRGPGSQVFLRLVTIVVRFGAIWSRLRLLTNRIS